jgi:hypothetical protein
MIERVSLIRGFGSRKSDLSGNVEDVTFAHE